MTETAELILTAPDILKIREWYTAKKVGALLRISALVVLRLSESEKSKISIRQGERGWSDPNGRHGILGGELLQWIASKPQLCDRPTLVAIDLYKREIAKRPEPIQNTVDDAFSKVDEFSQHEARKREQAFSRDWNTYSRKKRTE